jgi:basic membrane protein A
MGIMKSFNEHTFSRRQFVKLGGGSAVALVLAGCASGGGSSTSSDSSASDSSSSAASIKPGFITLHDENSTYDLNFINAAKEACQELGISEDTYMLKTNVPEGQECYNAAAELADAGCNIIFADSFGHEDYMIQAAKEFPDIQFCHSTGTKAHTEGLDNYHNAFASIYEGRYLAGVAAGMKLNEMIDSGKITADQAKMGYVGAYTYAEVISGYTSFYLGAKSVCPSVTMEVTFTGSWYDETAEKEGATKLINDGCVLISQHADSMGAPTACENAGVPDVSYNGSTQDACPNTYIISSRINWVPYYKYAIQAVMDGSTIDTDWTGNLSTGSVELTDLNTSVAADGTQDKLDEVKSKLEDGSLHVFDTSTFTVKGAKLDSYEADVDTDPNYTPDTEVVSDGYFHESEYRSAPYFDVQIDGIELLDTAF